MTISVAATLPSSLGGVEVQEAAPSREGTLRL